MINLGLNCILYSTAGQRGVLQHPKNPPGSTPATGYIQGVTLSPLLLCTFDFPNHGAGQERVWIIVATMLAGLRRNYIYK